MTRWISGSYSYCSLLPLPSSGYGFSIDSSPYTKIRAFTKLTYIDPEYVTRRGPVQVYWHVQDY